MENTTETDHRRTVLVNSLRKKADSLEEHNYYYVRIIKCMGRGNIISIPLFALGLSVSPFVQHKYPLYWFPSFGAGLFVATMMAGVCTEIVERTCVKNFLERIEKDLEDFANYLHASGNEHGIVDVVTKARQKIRSQFDVFVSWNVHNPIATTPIKPGMRNFVSSHQTEKYKHDFMQMMIYIPRLAGFIIRNGVQGKPMTDSRLAADIREICADLEQA